MPTKKKSELKTARPLKAVAVATTENQPDELNEKFARNAPNGELSNEEKYFQQNTSNTKERAYMVNNNQLPVSDLPSDFPVELLTEAKQSEFAAHHSA